ncbi:MAG: hypothetical protein M0027_13590 [Candidatus Dormibacteraeota bacterium]|nr:hypothetical protein [Candidatus Dormibacteraeota bacterium]
MEATDPVGAPGGPQPRWGYAEWARALADYFFTPDLAGQPAPLSLDDETAAAIRRLPAPDAGAELASTVRAMLRGNGEDPFSRFNESWRQWKAAGATAIPPFLPLLGVAVLAASRMEASKGVAPHNYYWRLRQLLGLPLTRAAVPGYDDAMPDLWAGLAHWLDDINGGDLGLSTVDMAPPQHIRYIGAALSQVELRRSDRQKLGQFFRYLRLAPGDAVEPGELLSYFRVWAETAHLSAGARRASRDPAAEARLSGILASDLRNWDGRERDSEGRPVGNLALTLSLRYPPALGFVAERIRDSPAELQCRLASAGSVTLRALTEGWYEPLPVRPSDAQLRGGLRLEGEGYSFVMKGGRCFVFAEDDELGCLVSQRSAPVLRDCAVLIEATLRPQAEAFLRSWARNWREIAVHGAIPSGWTVFAGVRLAPSSLPPPAPELSCLVPSAGTRISLENGLRLPRGSSCYLTGGEPDVWLPHGETGPVRVDGSETVPDAAGRVQLSGLGLPEGAHTLQIGPATRAFRSMRSLGLLRPIPGARVVLRLGADGTGWVFRGYHATGQPETPAEHEVWVQGVLTEGVPGSLVGSGNPAFRLRAGADEYILVGARPGEVMQVPVLPPPAWAAAAGLCWNFDEVYPPFVPVWVLAHWPHHWRAHLAQAVRPGERATEDPAKLAAWRDAFTLGCYPEASEDGAEELWDAYLDVADAL